jgi:hypothetical protein
VFAANHFCGSHAIHLFEDKKARDQIHRIKYQLGDELTDAFNRQVSVRRFCHYFAQVQSAAAGAFFLFAFPSRREISFQVYPSLCYNRIPRRARKVRGGAICKAYYRKQPARVLFAANSNTPYK